MDAVMLEALCGSIRKWREIVAGHGVDAGTSNCALCQVYWNKGEGCEGCPVMEVSKVRFCKDTPHERWLVYLERHQYPSTSTINKLPKHLQEKATELAQEELDFLISLLPDDQQEVL